MPSATITAALSFNLTWIFTVLPSDLVVDLSRVQFAFTVMFHFLFVPLTLGLTWLLVAMEAAYLKTGKAVYKDMTRFWGKLLAINFAIGIITGITMEFEFGLNWAYFSRLIGGSFGPILAIEGITAFMLEATMFGMFFFTWDKLSRRGHFAVTFLLALGASLSIVNILAANSWMQHPIATHFSYQTMSVNLTNIAALYLSMLSQIRIGHVAFGSFLTGAMFMMGISAYYMLKNQDVNFAKRSFAVAVGFGFIAVLVVAFYGDQNGLQVSKYEPEKMAAIEAQWTTQKAPASWYLIAFPHQAKEKNTFTIKIPYALSLIATHSLTGTVEGAKPLIATFKQRIKNGIKSYEALMRLRKKTARPQDVAIFNKNRQDIGYVLLLTKFAPDVAKATPAQIDQTAQYALPQFSVAFWSFRIMLGMWAIMFVLIIIGFILCWRRSLMQHRGYLRMVLYAIPVPWIALEAGWVLAEVGRQPWAVHQTLPTFLGTSSINLASIIASLSGFVILYAILFCIESFLMFKFARRGPSSLVTGKYHFEQAT